MDGMTKSLFDAVRTEKSAGISILYISTVVCCFSFIPGNAAVSIDSKDFMMFLMGPVIFILTQPNHRLSSSSDGIGNSDPT